MVIVYVDRDDLNEYIRSGKDVPNGAQGKANLMPVEIDEKALKYATVYDEHYDIDYSYMINELLKEHLGEDCTFKVKYEAQQYVAFAKTSDSVFIGIGQSISKALGDLYDNVQKNFLD